MLDARKANTYPEGMADPVLSRRKRIVELAHRDGRVSVDELAQHLRVTPQTIRRDLNDLARQNLLARTHGGATANSTVENLSYETRRQLAKDEKQAIGAAAAALIPDNASLFISIGTTTEEVASGLVDRRGLLFITNNLNVVDTLMRSPHNEVIVTGGRVRRADRAAVGAPAVAFIRNFKVDFAVIGASAIDEDGALLDFDINEVQVAQAILQNSRSVILVADSSKLGRPAPVRIGHLSDVDIFVTDCVSPAVRAVCEAGGVRVIETSSPKDEVVD
jgi:DeoR family transcriptional regulator, glycerol-3-phosphate regulon repressor